MWNLFYNIELLCWGKPHKKKYVYTRKKGLIVKIIISYLKDPPQLNVYNV